MTPKRAITAIKLDYLVRTLLGIACVIAGITVALNPTSYPAWVVWLVISLQLFGAWTTHRRVVAAQTLGEWRERWYIVNSLEEAGRRDMAPIEWVTAYVERMTMESADAGAKENPGQSED